MFYFCTYIHTYKHTYIHTYGHRYIHTYIHIYTLSDTHTYKHKDGQTNTYKKGGTNITYRLSHSKTDISKWQTDKTKLKTDPGELGCGYSIFVCHSNNTDFGRARRPHLSFSRCKMRTFRTLTGSDLCPHSRMGQRITGSELMLHAKNMLFHNGAPIPKRYDNTNTTAEVSSTVPAFISCTKCVGSLGIIHNRTPNWHPMSGHGWDNWLLTSQLNVAFIRKLRGSFMSLAYFVIIHCVFLQPGTGRRPIDLCMSLFSIVYLTTNCQGQTTIKRAIKGYIHAALNVFVLWIGLSFFPCNIASVMDSFTSFAIQIVHVHFSSIVLRYLMFEFKTLWIET